MLRRFATSVLTAAVFTGLSVFAAPLALADDGRNATNRGESETTADGFRDTICYFFPYACERRRG